MLIMKFLKLSLLLTLIAFLAVNVNSQTEDYKWFDLAKPNGTSGSTVTGDLSSIEITPSGDIFFIYVDFDFSNLLVKKLDVLSNTWSTVYSETISGVTLKELETYQTNQNIYIGTSSNIAGFNFYLWKFDYNQESVSNLYYGAPCSMSVAGTFDFVVDENNQHLHSAVKDPNGFLVVDTYNLATTSTNIAAITGVTLNNHPEIAIDHINSLLYTVGNESSEEYILLRSPLQTTLNLSVYDGVNGYIPSSLYAGASYGNEIGFIEKANSSPDIVLNHYTGTIYESFRLGELNSNTDANIVPSALYTPEFIGGSNLSTFSIGFNWGTNELIAYDVKPDGTVNQVASNNNPILETATAEGIVFGTSDKDRLATFFHAQVGGDGTDGGRFMITNNPPSLNSYTVNNGCLNNYSYIIEDLSFTDLDGDEVEILNDVTSSNASIIDPSTIYVYSNPHVIEANPEGIGSVDLTIQFTDGLDTISEVITVEVVALATVNFTVSEINACIYDGEVDINEFVTEPGGSAYLQSEFSSSNGIINFNELLDYNGSPTLPYTDFVEFSFIDGNGCSSSTPSLIPFTIFDQPSANLSVTNTTCGNTDGAIEALNINSPNGTYYTYWNSGAQNVSSINDLSPGTYYFNIIDEKDCKFTSQADIEASDFNVTGTITEPTCHDKTDGAIDLEVFGGSGNYSILWSTGHGSEDLTSLGAGNYAVTVTDDSGCQATKSFNLTNPQEFKINYSTYLPNCGNLNGAINNFNSEGGVAPFTFDWSNGASTQELNNIGAGYYEVTVTDDNNCVAQESYFFNSIDAPSVYLDNKVNASCNLDNGSLDLYISPAFGEQITSIVWSNGATTEDISGLSPGNYQVTIFQSNGCNATYSWTIKNKAPSKPGICIVTVDTTTNTNLVVWEKDANNPQSISYYNIYRETSNVGQYQKIDTVNHSSISVFNDVVASPENRSWRYKISAVNECGVESNLSQSHKTIHLVTTDLGGGEKGISWDNYEGFEYNSYDLLRYTDVNGWEILEADIPLENTPFKTDTPPSITNLNYIIEVLPPGGLCSATEGKAQDYNAARSNKPSSIFNPGDGTGDPNNSLSKEENGNYTVALYPNPSNGLFKIALYHKNPSSNLDMKVIDLNGKIIYSNQIKNGVNYISIDNIDSGIYHVKISDDNFIETLKVIIK
ncbi:MAG: hypothetical protein COA32_00905 [Fluviicola sp.]|nr:MAG: hypothetical protein COA32_00905 [Fluviicola sp.]